MSVGSGGVACPGCLPRLCATKDGSGRVTGLAYHTDTGAVVAVPACGSGGGGGTLSCCPGHGAFPSVLYATFSGGTGTCACLNGITVPMSWTGSVWSGAFSACSTTTSVVLSTGCSVGVSGGCNSVSWGGTTSSCAPLYLTATFPVSGCCSGNITVTITEVAP